MNIDQYCQRQRCKHVEYEQFLACFHVARVCQRQLGFLVLFQLINAKQKAHNYHCHIHSKRRQCRRAAYILLAAAAAVCWSVIIVVHSILS